MNEIEDKYDILDVKQTLIGNLMWFFLLFFVAVFIIVSGSYIGTIKEDQLRILYLIIFMFLTFKLIIWVGHPTLYMKERDK